MKHPLTVVGIGAEGRSGLGERALSAIFAADRISAPADLLGLFPELTAGKINIEPDLQQTLTALPFRRDDEKIVFLASGDPNFHGVGVLLRRRFPEETVEILPQASMLQEAFARAGISWADAVFLSAHTHLGPSFFGWLKRARKIGLLCGVRPDENTPAAISAKVLACGIRDMDVYVYGNFGYPDETHFHGTLQECCEKTFPSRSVLLLIHTASWQPVSDSVCRPDDAYAHRNGLITKQDIRRLCLERMNLTPGSAVWDIGAGSGAVSIEAAERAWQGTVSAFEKDDENLSCIALNRERFHIPNLTIIPGSAPESFSELPLPDAAFIGGSGGRAIEILDSLNSKHVKKVNVVMTFVMLDHLAETLRWCRERSVMPEVIQASINDGVFCGESIRLVPKNPVFILSLELS